MPLSALFLWCASQAFDVAKDIAKDRGEGYIGDKVTDFAKSLARRLADSQTLPQTHELLRQVRTAELVAARHVATAYRQRLKHLPAYEKSNEQLVFANALDNFLTDSLNPNAKSSIDFDALSKDRIGPAIDDMVNTAIAETTPGATASTRKILESAFLAELENDIDCKIPPDFHDLFTGDESAAGGGWYNIVALNISEAIATNERFRSLLFTAELTDIKQLATSVNERVKRLQEDGIASIQKDIENLHSVVLQVQENTHAIKAGVGGVRNDTQQILAVLQEVRDKTRVPLEVLQQVLIGFGETQTLADPQQIKQRLLAKADEYQSLRQRLDRLSDDDPRVQQCRQEAGRLIGENRFADADEKLAEAERIDLESVEELEALANRRRHSAAETRADRGAAAKLHFAYREAAEHYKSAAAIAPQDGLTRLDYKLEQVSALYAQGEEFGDNEALGEAIDILRSQAEGTSRKDNSFYWAELHNELGRALLALGSRERETPRLEDAVNACRAALSEFTQKITPEAWATAQNNLGNALSGLGEREMSPARLEEAVEAFREALKEWTQGQKPMQWAKAQNNLGIAFLRLGKLDSGTARLKDAVDAFQAALREYTPEHTPLEWARTNYNLGRALQMLGEREGGAARLEEEVEAFRAALRGLTLERAPLIWATTNMSLGAALLDRADGKITPARLKEALGCFRNAVSGYALCRDSPQLRSAEEFVAMIEEAFPGEAFAKVRPDGLAAQSGA